MNRTDFSQIDSIEFLEGGYFGPRISTKIYKEMDKYFYTYVCDDQRDVDSFLADDYSREKDSLIKKTVIELSQKEWNHIVKHIINHYKVLEWKEDYNNPYVLDGTQWSFAIVEDKKEIKTGGGSNAFPEKYLSLMNYLSKIENKALLARLMKSQNNIYNK
jgi:hypothetical protein